jgi:hypothetical protein
MTITTQVVEIVSFRAGHVTFFSSAFTSPKKSLVLTNNLRTSFSCREQGVQ